MLVESIVMSHSFIILLIYLLFSLNQSGQKFINFIVIFKRSTLVSEFSFLFSIFSFIFFLLGSWLLPACSSFPDFLRWMARSRNCIYMQIPKASSMHNNPISCSLSCNFQLLHPLQTLISFFFSSTILTCFALDHRPCAMFQNCLQAES